MKRDGRELRSDDDNEGDFSDAPSANAFDNGEQPMELDSDCEPVIHEDEPQVAESSTDQLFASGDEEEHDGFYSQRPLPPAMFSMADEHHQLGTTDSPSRAMRHYATADESLNLESNASSQANTVMTMDLGGNTQQSLSAAHQFYQSMDGLEHHRMHHATMEPLGEAVNGNVAMAQEEGSLNELEASGLSLSEIVSEARFRRRIAREYQRFLTTFTDDRGHSVYHGRIRAMCAANGESLEVSYQHLVEAHAFLAKLVANEPVATLAIFSEATMRVVLRLFEEYDQIRSEVYVRITHFPACESLRDLRHSHLNTLVRTHGVVTRRSGVFPQLTLIKYDCGRCGAILGPFVQDLQGGSSARGSGSGGEVKVTACSECESRGPFSINATQTVYRNFQKLTLQESPGTVPAGRLPRHRDVLLLADLIDAARPGELIEVTGIYRNNFSYALNAKNGFPVFSTVIEANHVSVMSHHGSDAMDSHANQSIASSADGITAIGGSLTEEDVKDIRRLAEDPHIGRRIVQSIAPSIYGHEDVKLAIALALFGGQSKNVQGKHPIRGDINVLLLGDPGTAKSQFLKYVEKIAPRAVYTTGQGASAVGLTASVRKDPVTREWTLEGGALVLADKGVCLIDEFDKMNDADRTSIHEAMEQQSISISKAGIVTSLQARASIIAAANPIRGRYISSLPLSQNVHLTEPILSRFDVLCVVRDVVEAVSDERLARFVVGSHIRSHRDGNDDGLADAVQLKKSAASAELTDETSSRTNSNNNTTSELAVISQELLRKYIVYAKGHVRPELSQMDVDKIARLYADLRRESLASGSIPITVRHIESMVRMAEAHARMHLRSHVRSDDIDMAIRVMLESFIGSQKYAVMGHLRRAFGKYCGFRRDHAELLLLALNELVAMRQRAFGDASSSLPSSSVKISMADLEAKAREMGIFDVKGFVHGRVFVQAGYTLLDNGLTIGRS